MWYIQNILSVNLKYKIDLNYSYNVDKNKWVP